MENLHKLFNRLKENQVLAAEIETAKEKFAFKPFALTFRPLAKLAHYSKFGLSGFSIITGFGCLYFGMIAALPEFVAAILAVLILLLIELVKAYALNIGFVQSYAKRSFSAVILLGLLFAGASVFLSLKGVASLYRAADDTGQILEAKQKHEYDSIAKSHNEAITAAKNELEAFKKSITWKGKIDMYNKANAAVIKQLNERISQAEADKREALSAIKNVHNEQIKRQTAEAGFNVTLWIALSACNEAGILLCLWFIVYYQYRIATDAEVINEAANYTLSITDIRRLLEYALINSGTSHKLPSISQPVIGFKLGQNKTTQPPSDDNVRNNVRNASNNASNTHNASNNVRYTQQPPAADNVSNNVRYTHDTSNTHNVSNTQNVRSGICAYCGKPFKKRTGWHTYCSEACKIAAWEKRTGKKYVPKKK